MSEVNSSVFNPKGEGLSWISTQLEDEYPLLKIFDMIVGNPKLYDITNPQRAIDECVAGINKYKGEGNDLFHGQLLVLCSPIPYLFPGKDKADREGSKDIFGAGVFLLENEHRMGSNDATLLLSDLHSNFYGELHYFLTHDLTDFSYALELKRYYVSQEANNFENRDSDRKRKVSNTQKQIAMFYHHGLGVLQDLVLAHVWYDIAAMNMHEYARKRRDEVSKLMTSSERAQARQIAKKCVSTNFRICDYE